MKKLPRVCLVIILILIAFVVVACVFYYEDKAGDEPAVRENPAGGEKCVMENCHGLEIACGANVPEACTEIYVLGDRCREFASCGIVDGKCQPILTGQFSYCKSCVKKCESDYADDSMKMFDCEASCRQTAEKEIG